MNKIVIPYFGERIASRFDTAQNFILANVENGQIANKDNIKIVDESPLKKIDILANLGANILICDGLTKSCENYLVMKGIQIFPWIQGNIEDILVDFIANTML